MNSRGLLNLLRRRPVWTGPQRRSAQSVAVLGAPFSRGQGRRGVERGPKAIRDAGLIQRLNSLGYAVHDLGDLNFQNLEQDNPFMDVKFPRTVGAANELLSAAVSKAISSEQILVTLGGDHSLAIGSVGGHAHMCPDLCLIWVDAHADINTPTTSPSGNLHGQPVSFMLKELEGKISSLPGFSWSKPFLSSSDLVYIGLRDVDPGEHYILKNLGIQYYSMRDIDRLGVQKVMEVTLDSLMSRNRRPIHLSFDIDSFDPSLAPATGTPVNGGLTFREGIYITEEIHNTGLLSVMDLVEVNPGLGGSRQAVEATAALAVDVIASSLGQTREGAHVPYKEISAVNNNTGQLCL